MYAGGGKINVNIYIYSTTNSSLSLYKLNMNIQSDLEDTKELLSTTYPVLWVSIPVTFNDSMTSFLIWR